jgi:hypothetical protein
MNCIEDHKKNCKGSVEPRMSLSGTGMPIVRCDKHWEERLQRQREHHQWERQARNVDYLDAGERWEEA